MAYPVESTPEFDDWMARLDDAKADAVAVVVAAFVAHADALGAAVLKPIKTSRHQAMRELRIQTIRVLAAVDPRGIVVLLWGGDKAGLWNEWYPPAIAYADALYDRHLAELKED
ncbi:MAG: hypothetical protein QOK40_3331 [Miltoncostaeaceae bacterium]|nr:hypothetical protein [Miltoncostaeaceae bacterium]